MLQDDMLHSGTIQQTCDNTASFLRIPKSINSTIVTEYQVFRARVVSVYSMPSLKLVITFLSFQEVFVQQLREVNT